MADAEGWIQVRRPKFCFRPPPPPSPSSRSVPLLSKEAIANEFLSFRTQFEASPCCGALREIVSGFISDNLKDDENPITKAICLGIGTFDPPDGGWVLKRRSHTQLAAFLIIVEELEKKISKGRIECIFQEPIFASSDISFVTSMGHSVVDSPVGSNRVDSKTFFFGVHLYRDVYAVALKGELPAMYIGTGWDIWSYEAFRLSPDDDNLEAVQTMEKTYKKFTFPEDKGTTIFYATSIYLRQPQHGVSEPQERDDQNVEQKEHAGKDAPEGSQKAQPHVLDD
ncbi:hypothetical protein V8C37DRAFT_391491 [Trichoderma ceciliae]